MVSADKLFQLKLDKEYGDLFFLMVGLFQPTFFLAGVPRDFAALDLDIDYPRGLKAFTQFALAPLVAVLHCHSLRLRNQNHRYPKLAARLGSVARPALIRNWHSCFPPAFAASQATGRKVGPLVHNKFSARARTALCT